MNIQTIEYQCCPVCHGLGVVRPLWNVGADNGHYITCDVCNGEKVILPALAKVGFPALSDSEFEKTFGGLRDLMDKDLADWYMALIKAILKTMQVQVEK